MAPAFPGNAPPQYPAQARARGWGLWKAMLQLSDRSHIDPALSPEVERVISDILDDHERHG